MSAQLCEDLFGQLSGCWGLRTKMVPSVQGLVKKADNLTGYLISPSHLQRGQKRSQIGTLSDRPISVRWANWNHPVPGKQQHPYRLQRALVLFSR